MRNNFDVNRWGATAAVPYNPPPITPNIDARNVPNRPSAQVNFRGNISWRKYLCLAPVALGISIACIAYNLPWFRALLHQDSVDISININNEPLTEIDVGAVTDVEECLWILSSASSINIFPLLIPVNEPLHRVVLGELFEGTLDKLAQTQTKASLILQNRAQSLNDHLAQAAQVFTHSEYSTVALQTDINAAYKELEDVDSFLDSLANIYHGVKASYDIVNASKTSALEEVKLTNQTEFWSYAQGWGNGWFWKTPWAVHDKESKKMEEVRLGFIALELEVKRLEQIKQIIHWLKNTLQDLSTSIHGWHTECTLEAEHNCFLRKVRDWFQQNFVYNDQIRITWVELLGSVDKGEQKIHLEISNKWCKIHQDKLA